MNTKKNIGHLTTAQIVIIYENTTIIIDIYLFLNHKNW
jgi:hypothetical protein